MKTITLTFIIIPHKKILNNKNISTLWKTFTKTFLVKKYFYKKVFRN